MKELVKGKIKVIEKEGFVSLCGTKVLTKIYTVKKADKLGRFREIHKFSNQNTTIEKVMEDYENE